MASSRSSIRTLYFGGGTPSLCTPSALQALLDHAAQLHDCSAAEEITLEANPDDLTEAYLSQLRRTQVNRLSIGIQSLDDACLKLMNRRHSAAQAAEAVRAAQRAGFENITVDVIFGVPGFGGDSLCRTLDGILSLGVQHISAYHLTIEAATAFGRRAEKGAFAPVDETVSEAEFMQVHDTLSRAGFEHYEVSNFGLPGFRARHNSSYWKGDQYLGIGAAAHSFDGQRRDWNVSSVNGYIDGQQAEGETLTNRDCYNEYVMISLRTAEGIDLHLVAERFGAQQLEKLLTQAAPLTEAGLLQAADGHLAVPPERFLVSDAVIEAFFEIKNGT